MNANKQPTCTDRLTAILHYVPLQLPSPGVGREESKSKSQLQIISHESVSASAVVADFSFWLTNCPLTLSLCSVSFFLLWYQPIEMKNGRHSQIKNAFNPYLQSRNAIKLNTFFSKHLSFLFMRNFIKAASRRDRSLSNPLL